ncbi:hypothetical protein CRE_03410 [Caenorhabditis remanei]|uniref:Mutator-like transposase domain-containing protein n=2 Tax=Caenorhabditis remanei TaxID=31234 RepID=E3NAP2_CAERE|nr:hypothetical protein CRE_03410 [Caenorhabditis remanei]
MVLPSRDVKRVCVFCNKSGSRTEMTPVTKNPVNREVWYRKLGKTFKLNCEKSRYPYVCLSHFPAKKASSPRAQIYPYKNGRPHTRKVEESDTEDDSSTDEEGDLFTDPNYDIEDEYECEENKKSFKNIICNWNNLSPILSKCWNCLRNGKESSARASMRLQGAALHVSYDCVECGSNWKWSSSTFLDREGKQGQKQCEVNLDISVSVLSTGNAFTKIASLFDVLELPFISNRRYNKLIENVLEASVAKCFFSQRSEVLAIIKENSARENGVDLAGDGQFDSRGYSAVLCRFSIMDIKTKFLLDFEVCRKERGGNSIQLEKMGHKGCIVRLLQELKNLTNLDNPIKSLTTDRCVNLAQVMKDYPTIVHHFDSWHFIRSIRKDVAKVFKNIDSKNNLGNVVFDKVQSCCHSTNVESSSTRNHLDLTKKDHKKAFDVLLGIMTKPNRQRDIQNISPYFATSALESFHSVATSYLPKEHFFDKKGYDLRSKLACLHWNALQLDELSGRRKVEIEHQYYCKTKKKLVTKFRKTRPMNNWRKDIGQFAKEMVLVGCLSSDEEEIDEEVEARAAVEAEMYTSSNSP